MSHFGLKINKSQSPDKTPYTHYYPHGTQISARKWDQQYYQIVSIDPARINYAIRIERRYHNGWITPVVFDKTSVEAIELDGYITICNTYENLTKFLDKYKEFYKECHFIIIERQLPQNYRATRVAQHSISYFSLLLRNTDLLPSIIEVDPKLKGKMLGAPKGISDKQLKVWATEKARELLNMRSDHFSLQVLDHFRNKQDDLSDTVCQIEALFIYWGMGKTEDASSLHVDTSQNHNLKLVPNKTSSSSSHSITLQIKPTDTISLLTSSKSYIKPSISMISFVSDAPPRTDITLSINR